MSLDAINNPFVGLRPFESDESLLFFGRQAQTIEILQRLHQFHFVAVTGSSGSGKSSLIKAGVVPQLKAGYLVRLNDHWVISTMKPGETPINNLVDSIIDQIDHNNNGLTDLNSEKLQEKIRKKGVDGILEVLKLLLKSNSNFLLLVDQFEELFRFSFDKKDLSKTNKAIEFVNILIKLSRQTELPIFVIITMRSDFIGDCAQFYGLPEAMNQSQYIVPRLNRVQLENIIEAPIRLFNGKIDPALTDKLLNDSYLVKDELPLLQHALMRIWETEKIIDQNGELDIGDYKRIGGIQKALSNHADEALDGKSEKELSIIKKIFQALTTIDENGRKIRRPAHLIELQAITGTDKETLLSIIDLFIKGGKNFLVISKAGNEHDLLIDISHESLIRQWSILNAWVDEEAEAAKMFLRLSESTRLYHEKKKDFLVGNELNQMLQWFYAFKPDKIWAQRYNSEYENNIRYLKESEKEQKKQRLKKLRNRRLLIAALVFVIIMISAFAYSIYKNDLRNKKALALNYWQSGQLAKTNNNLLDGLHLVAEASLASNDQDLIQKFLIDGEAYLPVTRLIGIIPQKDIINSVAFNASDDRILIASNDGTARIIDKTTGDQLGPPMNNQWPVTSAVFSPDNKMVLTAGNGKVARIWDVATGKQIHVFRFEEDVMSAVFSPDGKLALTGSANDSAQVWEIATGKMLYGFKHEEDVLSGVFSPDGTKILTTCINDSKTHLWDLATKKEILFFESSSGADIKNALFSPDGTKILALSVDATISVWEIFWDLTKVNQLASFKHNDRVNDAVFSPDSKWIISACSDKTAHLWDIKTQKQVGTAMKHEGAVYTVAFSSDGKQILTGGWDKNIRLWEAESGVNENNILAKLPGKVTGVFSGHDETKVIFTSDDSTVRTWDLRTKKQLGSFKHQSGVNSAVFNADATKLMTASDDSDIRIWEPVTGKQTNSLHLDDKVNTAMFSPDGKLILTVTNEDYIRIWNPTLTSTAIPISTYSFPGIYSVVFSADSKSILIASNDSVHLLNTATAKQIISFKHDKIVKDAVFSPDGDKILTASEDFTARLWDVATGRQIGSSMKHHSAVNKAAFSKDGRWIITSCWDNAAHLWDAVTLKEIGNPKKHEGNVTNAVFYQNGKWILTAGYDSTVRLWDIAGDLDMPASLFKLQANAITGVDYNIETGETNCIPIQEWKASKEEYHKRAGDHFKKCKYPQHNLWRSFNNEDAEKLRPDIRNNK